ncbi:hypothetical protein C1645_736543 [Glomus cerebriforme]|uniref:Uncharacterized protein n=1 Tax=Glomus cerebriforme TaxID=658196 RepID=A0A397T239_9GLOM|nr:hypothetical protein C1645_736543 [Glomus cerebriforme]
MRSQEKGDTVPLTSIDETLNVENIVSNNNGVQEQAAAVNIPAKQKISDNDLSPDGSQIIDDGDDAVNFERKPLAPITNNKKVIVLRNSTLDDLNETSGSLDFRTPVANGFNFVSSNFNSSTLATAASYIQKQEDKMKMNRDFLEELKCFFLRVRNPKKSAFEDLV